MIILTDMLAAWIQGSKLEANTETVCIWTEYGTCGIIILNELFVFSYKLCIWLNMNRLGYLMKHHKVTSLNPCTRFICVLLVTVEAKTINTIFTIISTKLRGYLSRWIDGSTNSNKLDTSIYQIWSWRKIICEESNYVAIDQGRLI